MRTALGLLVVGLLLGAPFARGEEHEAIYRYIGPAKRPVFVNGLARVPAKYRKTARRIDLSHVSLNTELGAELRAEVDREYGRLKAEERRQLRAVGRQPGRQVCQRGEAEVSAAPGLRGFLHHVWATQSALVVIAGLILALIVFAPAVSRRVGPGRWGRVLVFVIPLLGVIGLLSYAASRAGRVVQEVRCEMQRGERQVEPAEQLRALNELRQVMRVEENQPAAGE